MLDDRKGKKQSAHKITNTAKTVLVYRTTLEKTSFFLDFDNRATHIMAAIWADFMRRNGVTAFRAIGELLFLFVVM